MSLHSTKEASIQLKNIAGERTKATGGGENMAKGNFVLGNVPCTKKTSYATKSKLMRW